MKTILISAAAAAMVLGNVSASHAFLDTFLDREPTPEERAAIEGVLFAEGFTAWDEIEFDNDGYWEIDDAIAADGQSYDLKLDTNLALLESDPD
jgi:hypothetical protein